VDAAGVRFAYRRFGKAGGVPLVSNQHFTGAMDHWDPLVTDGLAATREVILFNNAGISNSSGEAPRRSRKWVLTPPPCESHLGLQNVDANAAMLHVKDDEFGAGIAGDPGRNPA
jgi:hypothetical protein